MLVGVVSVHTPQEALDAISETVLMYWDAFREVPMMEMLIVNCTE